VKGKGENTGSDEKGGGWAALERGRGEAAARVLGNVVGILLVAVADLRVDPMVECNSSLQGLEN